MSEAPLDNGATESVASPVSGPSDTAPIPTPGSQGANGEASPPASDVKAESSPAAADDASKATEGKDSDGQENRPDPKPNGGFQKRIAELTRRSEQAEQDRSRLLSLLERNAPAQQPAGAEPKGDDGDQPPKQSDFNSYEEFIRADARWHARKEVEQTLARSNQQTSEQQAQEAFDAQKASFHSEVTKAGKDIEGFEEAYKVFGARVEDGGPEISPMMADFMINEVENKALMVKYLGENPDEATKLSKLHPRTMINRLARLDAQLGAKPPAKVSNAPAPPPTLNGSSAPVVDLSDPKTPIDVYAEAWHARRNKR